MATQINQIDDELNRCSTLKVEGELFEEDARLLEKIGVEIRAASGNRVVIDLADLDFLDSDAAAILRRLDSLDDFTIQGIEIFLQNAVNAVERTGSN